jgi:hypothetical protein
MSTGYATQSSGTPIPLHLRTDISKPLYTSLTPSHDLHLRPYN